MNSVDTHRRPGGETVGLYPGLVVSDGKQSRQAGSITVGRTRLPVWAFIGDVVREGWRATDDYYDERNEEEFGREAAALFFYSLMDLRGEFGRLLLVLADAERCSTYTRDWTDTKRHRRRLAAQMRRCLALLDEDAA